MVEAEAGKQELKITRLFDIPLDLLFKAYTQPDILEQWMGTRVLKLDCKKHGSYHFENRDSTGKLLFGAHGTIHEFDPMRKISRTFEMENTTLGIQLEIYEFQQISVDRSKLEVHVIFESVEKRDQLLALPFKQGLNMAHNRLDKYFLNSK